MVFRTVGKNGVRSISVIKITEQRIWKWKLEGKEAMRAWKRIFRNVWSEQACEWLVISRSLMKMNDNHSIEIGVSLLELQWRPIGACKVLEPSSKLSESENFHFIITARWQMVSNQTDTAKQRAVCSSTAGYKAIIEIHFPSVLKLE